ncbi:hypothetical protein IAQ61_010034 [Plenodomus lingam]|uniref:uncharacterized protein n=1 Tax=Leptosphaeria maculans TaxID=5022 RepID=UPI00332E7D88|nr:hypothetical protein IAQ61_010034 [Plenodomus lingam]
MEAPEGGQRAQGSGQDTRQTESATTMRDGEYVPRRQPRGHVILQSCLGLGGCLSVDLLHNMIAAAAAAAAHEMESRG